MSLRITPEMMEALYELLRLIPPFRGAKLPHADAVEFKVTAHRDRGGHFQAGEEPEIALSVNGLRHYQDVVQAMAHEMVHFAVDIAGQDDNHGPNFRRFSRRVCKRFGWDWREFIK